MMGTDIVNFVRELMKLGFTCIGVLGYEGTGKSFGMKTLPTGTNIWYNADGKIPTYKGGKEEYGIPAKKKYTMELPKTYQDILDHIKKIVAKGLLEPNPVAFLVGHIEDYKSGETTRQRLKTLGKLTQKVNIEDMLAMCYYTEVTPLAAGVVYQLRTQNNGRNTGRTLESQHETLLINNDFAEIIRSYDNY